MKGKYNVIVAGIGGQGILTLAGIIGRAAAMSGYEVKGSELHGLAMRFGATNCHIRFGKDIHSPLVTKASADLIVAMEPLEACRVAYYAGPQTVFVLDKKEIKPLYMYLDRMNYPPIGKIIAALGKFAKNVIAVDASEKSKEITGSMVEANSYLLGKIVAHRLLPLKRKYIEDAMEEVLHAKMLTLNKKVYQAALEE